MSGALMSAILLSSHSIDAYAGAEPGKHRIEIIKGQFVPNTLTIQRGDSVEWINRDFIPHTATANDAQGAVVWDTGNLNKGESMGITFSSAGTQDYICLYHPSMTAEITIID